MTAAHIARGDDPARLRERIALLQGHVERLADELEHAREETTTVMEFNRGLGETIARLRAEYECSTCGGSGEVGATHEYNPDDPYDMVPCRDCDGTGSPLRAALARRSWQSIETAPQIDVRILLARIEGGRVCWVCTGGWSAKYQRWWDGVEPCGLAGPTHWMCIPAPPVLAREE